MDFRVRLWYSRSPVNVGDVAMRISLRLGVVLGGILLLLGGFGVPAGAQRFPYQAPQAPEFDRQGNYVAPGSESPEPEQRRERARYEAPQAPRTHRTRRRYRPQPPQPSTRPTRAAAPPPAVQQPQQMPDCTQYFSMMAGARNQQELQWNARLYLTCLLKRGWRPEQARQEVIRVIESLRASRR